MTKAIFTLGHSTRSITEFIKILKTYQVSLLIDVRHYPGSRHCPQFGKARLKRSLEENGISYIHMLELGGRRSVKKEMKLNLGWRSLQFRGYADYMQTKEFKHGLKELISLAKEQPTAIMCAEALPWRCHRSLIADALLARGFKVQNIFTARIIKPHVITSFAKVYRKNVTYPKLP